MRGLASFKYRSSKVKMGMYHTLLCVCMHICMHAVCQLTYRFSIKDFEIGPAIGDWSVYLT